MPLIPYTFKSGTIAASGEINSNFNSLGAAIGLGSSSNSFRPPGDMILGPRRNVHLTNVLDVSNGSKAWLHVGWNAEQRTTDGKLYRYIDGEPATVLRVGKSGLSVMTSKGAASGTLDSQIRDVFYVGQYGYIYLHPEWHFTTVKSAPVNPDDFLLTYRPFATPKVIYENTAINAGTLVRKASDYGIANNAVALEVAVYMEGGGTSSELHVMRGQNYAGIAPSPKYGVSTYVQGTNKVSRNGKVLLGYSAGSFNRTFVEVRVSNTPKASLFIVGEYF